jgi:aspartate racemase
MHIGLIVGIGPAATDYYYRSVISTMAQAGREMHLTMARADTSTVLRNHADGNVEAQVAIHQPFVRRRLPCANCITLQAAQPYRGIESGN